MLLVGCKKNTESSDNYFVAKIAGFDLNCSTCILSFPDDSLRIKKLLGESPNNYYQTVNLERANYVIGQKIKVKVRKAEDNELKGCITLYPSYNYENIFVSGYNNYQDFLLNDTIDLAYRDCLNNFENQTSICFDSVLTDSRCPENVICIWAGEAIARFSLKNNQNNTTYFDLHVGTIDTLINDYKFSFVNLLPYPNTEIPTELEDYKAKIIIKRN
ncbi:MAG: hypothetical protein FD155_760 [Bacteroidetes bacterium]|nr:MAG: hypothetical protein FD155_760 [Bacteroidota bacterium]